MKRRDFLTRAPVVAAVSAAPMAAAAHWAEAADENPELLALGAELPAVEKAYQDALAAWRAAWDFWSPQWPLAPEACCNKYGAWSYKREIERDLRGAGLTRKGEASPWTIMSAAELEDLIERQRELLAKDDRRKRSHGKRFRQYRHEAIAKAELGLALLPGYLAEIERIRRESNFAEIDTARHRMTDELFAFVRRVLEAPSRSMAGVRIKAQACAALGRMQAYDALTGQMTDSTKRKSNMAGLLGAALLDVT